MIKSAQTLEYIYIYMSIISLKTILQKGVPQLVDGLALCTNLASNNKERHVFFMKTIEIEIHE